MEPRDLLAVSGASKLLYIFVQTDTLWKELYIEEYAGDFDFEGTWKATYIRKKTGSSEVPPSAGITVKGVYSDVLYNTYYCSTIDPSRWAQIDNVDKRKNLSTEDFISEYESKGIPVVIQDIVPHPPELDCIGVPFLVSILNSSLTYKRWPAFQKWSDEYLVENYGNVLFKTDKQIDVSLRKYIKYSNNVVEERPIYLFDNEFGERAPEMLTEYFVPEYFKQDFFELLEDRPSYRWILVGPARAGATFHKDPNWTSAWNGLIRGRKKWIMWPPDVPPLGIIPSNDGLEVTVPATMVQWFNDFYKKKHPVQPPIEFVQNPGDLVFIPSGWWHSVINLEHTVAVTQNYVSMANLAKVHRFLKTKQRLTEALKTKWPEVYAQLLEETNEIEGGWENLVEDDEDWQLGF